MSPSVDAHVVGAEVEDTRCLRVAALFSRREFQHRKAVGLCHWSARDRSMTIVVSAETLRRADHWAAQRADQRHQDRRAGRRALGVRELALIKVRRRRRRSQVIEAVNLFRANVIDVSPESLTVEATGKRRPAAGVGPLGTPAKSPNPGMVAVPRPRHGNRHAR